MKTVKILLVSLLFATGATTAVAQNKFAYLNSREILMLMPEIDTINKKLEAYQKELGETFDAMQAEYANKATEYQKKSPEWSETMQQQKTKEINGLREDIMAYQESAPTYAQKKQQELMEPVFKKVQDAINAVGKENSFTYIFDSSAGTIIYLDEATATNAAQLVKNKLGIKK